MFKNLLKVPINSYYTDSCSLEIDEDKIEILDHTLTSRVRTLYVDIVNVDTGEIGYIDKTIAPLPPEPYKISSNGINLRFLWVSRNCSKTKTTFKKLKVTISAKLLQSDYFVGLTASTIRSAYDCLMLFKVFKVSFIDFLNSTVSDIDVCKNTYLTPLFFHKSLVRLKTLSKHGKPKYFQDIIAKKSQGNYINLGLDINSRHGARPSTPYIKLYHKQLELESKSIEFYNKFLMHFDIKNLVRTEVTLKGYEHKKRLNKKIGFPLFKTLKDWLNISPYNLGKFFNYSINGYFEKKIGYQLTGVLSPKDSWIAEMMSQLILNNGYDRDSFKTTLNNYTGTQKTRLKKQIDYLYDAVISASENVKIEAENNEEINAFLYTFLSIPRIAKGDV